MILAAKLQIIICINLEDADKSTFFLSFLYEKEQKEDNFSLLLLVSF